MKSILTAGLLSALVLLLASSCEYRGQRQIGEEFPSESKPEIVDAAHCFSGFTVETMHDMPPEMVNCAHPACTSQAYRMSSNIITSDLKIYINNEGTVTEVKTSTCNYPDSPWEEEIEAEAFSCRYKPAWRNGYPIGVFATYKIIRPIPVLIRSDTTSP